MDIATNSHYATDSHVAVGPGTDNLNVQHLLERSSEYPSVRFKFDFSEEEPLKPCGIKIPVFLSGPFAALMEIMKTEMALNNGYTTLEEIPPTYYFKPMSPAPGCRICEMLLWVLTRPQTTAECVEYFQQKSMTAKEVFILIREILNRFEKKLVAYRSYGFQLWDSSLLQSFSSDDFHRQNPRMFKYEAKIQLAYLRGSIAGSRMLYLHNFFNFIMYQSVQILREFVLQKICNCELDPTDELFFFRAVGDHRWGNHVKKVINAYCQTLSHNLFNLDTWAEHMREYSTSDKLRRADILTWYRTVCMRNLIIINDLRAFNATFEVSTLRDEVPEIEPMLSWYTEAPN